MIAHSNNDKARYRHGHEKNTYYFVFFTHYGGKDSIFIKESYSKRKKTQSTGNGEEK